MAYEKKAVVKIDGDGKLMQCAKGLDSGECGYTPGAKVCGKCGAMPVMMKMVPMDDEEDMMYEDEMPMKKMKKRRPMQMDYAASMKANMEDDMMAEDEEEDDEEMMPSPAPMKKRPMPAAPMMDEEDDEEMMEDEEDDEEMMEEGKGWGMMGMSPDMKKNRKRRLATMGVKSASLEANGFMCAMNRKVYPGHSSVCDDCPGGCVSEKGMPGLLEVEGMVETMFKGLVIDSGYSANADMFVVDVDIKGKTVEAFVDGSSGELLGFHKLDESVIQQKSYNPIEFISFTEAADIAVKSFPGDVVAVEPDVFEGFDCYAVEIDGVDGKSYDVFVALDGSSLGHDIYDFDDVEEIEAEAAEIALKRAFSESERTSLADQGYALPDGSFPIKSQSDLRNAIQAFGRAKDKAAAKRHIMKRARALGKEDMIPANWLMGGKSASHVDDPDFLKSVLEFEIIASESDSVDGIN